MEQQARAARIVGTPDQFVDWLARWHEAGACDGFDILPAVLPVDLDLLGGSGGAAVAPPRSPARRLRASDAARASRPAARGQSLRRLRGTIAWHGGKCISACSPIRADTTSPGWRHGSVDPHKILGYDYYRRSAVLAERGKFDLFFVGDMLAAREKDGRVIAQGALNNIDSISITGRWPAPRNISVWWRPCRPPTTSPYAIAERFATLDHISGGRAGWNVITTANDDAALNFSRKSHMEKDAALRAGQGIRRYLQGHYGTAGKTMLCGPTVPAACSSIGRR